MFGSTKLELTFDSYSCKQAFLGLHSDEIAALKMIAVDEAFAREKTPPILSVIDEIDVKTGEILSGPFAGDVTAYEYKDGRCYIHAKLTDAELEHFSEIVHDRKSKLYPHLQAHICPVKFKDGEPHTIKIQVFKIVYDEKKNPFQFDDIDNEELDLEPRNLVNVPIFEYGKGNVASWPEEVVQKAFKEAFDNGPVICTIAKESDPMGMADLSAAFGKVLCYRKDDETGGYKGTIEFNNSALSIYFHDMLEKGNLRLSPRCIGTVDEYGNVEEMKIISFNPIPNRRENKNE